ncbi:MAG: gliding motility-associated C-terminal domain-containing protein, partial [Bacteroidota bacterium]
LETTIDIGSDVVIQQDSSRDFTLMSNLNMDQILSTDWTFNEESICTNCNSVDFTATVSGQLVVTLINEDGCIYMDSLFVTVFEPEIGVFIPNAFSPNGDQINDHFIVYAEEENAIIEQLQIFNRWGDLVYNGSNLPVNLTGWDGRFNGKVVNNGVYVYYAKVQINNTVREFQGDFTLFR